MLSTLQSISIPEPFSPLASASPVPSRKRSLLPGPTDDVSYAQVDRQTTEDVPASDGPRRREADTIETGDLTKGDSEYTVEDGRGGDTTEDEMDEDAVILKRPLET